MGSDKNFFVIVLQSFSLKILHSRLFQSSTIPGHSVFYLEIFPIRNPGMYLKFPTLKVQSVNEHKLQYVYIGLEYSCRSSCTEFEVIIF